MAAKVCHQYRYTVYTARRTYVVVNYWQRGSYNVRLVCTEGAVKGFCRQRDLAGDLLFCLSALSVRRHKCCLQLRQLLECVVALTPWLPAWCFCAPRDGRRRSHAFQLSWSSVVGIVTSAVMTDV